MVQTNPHNTALKPDPYYSELHATFGDRICAAREAAGLTQKVLASKMGVNIRTIQAWEYDKVEPRANKLQMVSALLNVSMVWLMSGLGSGIASPERRLISLEHDKIEILKELRSIRAVNKGLLRRLALLDDKISKTLNIS
ncbi:MAG: helix-turn-helix transcriptional regulator [Paracoccaceae bacterium]|nr:helix-turn-helix transcriptional regulator [Paracoccaceae bacterium]